MVTDRIIKFVLLFIFFIFTNLQANLINPNFNLGYTLSTSAETNNRQMHDFYTLKDIQNLNDLDSNEAGIENKINILIQYGLSKEEIAKSLQNMAEFKALTKDGMNEFNKIYNTEKEKVDKTNNLVDNIVNTLEIAKTGVELVTSVGVAKSGVKKAGEKVVKETFDIKNINTFKNSNIKDVEKFLDKELQGWTKKPLRDGNGIRYYDGKGGSFELNKGYANPKDDIHGNPYLKITVGSEKVRIPLK